MLTTVLIVLCACALRISAQGCPFWSCSRDMYSTKDLPTCLAKADEVATCIQNGLKQSDICQKCDKWDLSYHAHPSYISDLKTSRCYVKECKMRELSSCMRDLVPVVYFYDTSSIDKVISCVDQWKPALGSKTCLKEAVGIDLPGSQDPIDLFKQILTEVKGGCDPVLPIMECRNNLLPLSSLMMGPPGVGTLTAQGLTNAIEATTTCVQTALKEYPCKTMESLVPAIKDAVIPLAVKGIAGADRDGIYNTICGATDNPKFFAFFKK